MKRIAVEEGVKSMKKKTLWWFGSPPEILRRK
jgi:hypothetical protein